MASSQNKKTSEGIALLSIYGDEDDEMEELDDEEEPPLESQVRQELEEEQIGNTSANVELESSNGFVGVTVSEENAASFVLDERSELQARDFSDIVTPGRLSGLGTPKDSLFSHSPLPQKPAVVERRRQERVTIVDYGHDEVAMSPEPEEGQFITSHEISGRESVSVINVEFEEKTLQVLTHPEAVSHTQFSDSKDEAEANTLTSGLEESEYAVGEDIVMGITEEQKEIDLLNKFLPSPPKSKCSDELQARITKFIALKNTGRSYNAEVRNRKDYRNPDFLRHAVTYQDIDELGSCFSKDVFDPHGYDKSDFYDEIEADVRREMERREQERKRSPKIDFFSGGSQLGIVPTPKINLPNPGLPIAPGSGLNATMAPLDSVPRDGRQNKKSKWDKVDTDRPTSLPSGGQDMVPSGGARASTTLLPVSSAGTGYSAYAEQRRKEVEDKRSSGKKSERKS